MDYMTVKETAEKWNITTRWVQYLCERGKVEGAVLFGKSWAIPKDAERPPDSRRKENK